MPSIQEYCEQDGRSPFADWFNSLEARAAQKVVVSLARLELGNFSNVKSLGAGISEYKIDYGPGYRIYFAQEGQKLIILLGGGHKKRQSQDIIKAKQSWQDYKCRKKDE
jgi:putative addiction module killer protein